MSISSKIVELREHNNLTQTDLADRLGFNRSVLNRIEKGTRPVRDDELKILANFFKVSTDYLLDTENSAVVAFNDDETKIINNYRNLDSEGQNLFLGMINSLRLSHSKKTNSSASVVQKNSGGRNYLAVNGNQYVR